MALSYPLKASAGLAKLQKMPKLITIVTPSFNQAKYLDECICSVRDQVNSDLIEHIVIDGGSTDNSIEVLEKHSDWLKYWHSKPDNGQSAAINEGFRLAQGRILSWINSDDALAPGAARQMIKTLGSIDKPAWAYGRSMIVDNDSNCLDVGRLDPMNSLADILDYHNYLMQPGVFWNRALWAEVGGLDESLHFAMDFDLWVKFIGICPGIPVESIVGVNRLHSETKGATGGFQILRDIVEVYLRASSGNDPECLKKLADLSRDLSHQANVAISSGETVQCLQLLKLAFRAHKIAFFNRSSAKALLKRASVKI